MSPMIRSLSWALRSAGRLLFTGTSKETTSTFPRIRFWWKFCRSKVCFTVWGACSLCHWRFDSRCLFKIRRCLFTVLGAFGLYQWTFDSRCLFKIRCWIFLFSVGFSSDLTSQFGNSDPALLGSVFLSDLNSANAMFSIRDWLIASLMDSGGSSTLS